jgi:hypothetical protein
MAKTFQMPLVSMCAARDCAYNDNNRCHARAITIGDDAHPACDTFVRSQASAEQAQSPAAVGACKVTSCSHNRGLECHARSIQVGIHGDHPDCMTFEKR